MQEQTFSLAIVHDAKVRVSTSDLRDIIKEALAGKVDRYLGIVAENYGTDSHSRIIECTLRISNKAEVSVGAMNGYLSGLSENFQITQISRR
jgi:hypothetical protein